MGDRYPRDWDKRRKEVYKRDNYTCQNCDARGGPYGDAELHAHHSVPISKGGTHKKSNLITHCRRCHNAIHGNSYAPTRDDVKRYTSRNNTKKATPRNISIYGSEVTINEYSKAILFYGIILIPSIVILIMFSYTSLASGIIGSILYFILSYISFGKKANYEYHSWNEIKSKGRWDYSIEVMKKGEESLDQKEWMDAKGHFHYAARSFKRIYSQEDNKTSPRAISARNHYHVAKRRSLLCTDLDNENFSQAKVEQEKANELAKKIRPTTHLNQRGKH